MGWTGGAPALRHPCVQVEFVRHEEPVLNTGLLRGVGSRNNTFVIESFIDELAAAASRIP